MVEESEKKVRGVDIELSPPRKWISIDQAGLNFRGRFVPENEYDPECFTTKLSAEAKVNFEAWLRETTTLAVNTEINCQLGEFTIKKHVTQPLDPEIQANLDFIAVFESLTRDDIIQCAEVKHTVHRKWLRLIGMEHDIQIWDSDNRLPAYGFKKLYSASEPEWVKNIVDPWMARIFPGIELFIGPPDYSKTDHMVLYGFWPKEGPPTLKEFVVYKYPRVLQVFNILEYGRRWYRSMVFSSDPNLTFHALAHHSLSLSNELVSCCGDPTAQYSAAPSLVIIKYLLHDKQNQQTYVPARFLYGSLPDVLLEYYAFWQNTDDSLSGNVIKKDGYFASSSTIFIQLVKSGQADTSGFGFSPASALVTRRENDSLPDESGSWLHLINPYVLFHAYSGRSDSQLHESKSLTTKFWNGDDMNHHALIRCILRLESLSHILFWTKSAGKDSMNATIDLIELPRLRLTFERKVVEENQSRYYCIEQAGYYLTSCNNFPVVKNILSDLNAGIALKNDLGEHVVLLSCLSKPCQYRLRKGSSSFRLVYVRTDDEWVKTAGELTYFIFPVHLSGTMIQSKSIASTLYLLGLYLMTRNYQNAFRLIDNCVCDRPFTPQEAQIFRLFETIKDKVLVDGAACRLKLFFVTYGCTDIMPFPYNVEEDITRYINYYDLVSSHCRLSPDQESFILSKVPEESLTRSPSMINRERIIKVSFELTFQKSVSKLAVKNFTAQYPTYLQADPYHTENVDIDLLDVDKPTYKNMLAKLQYIKYTRPEACSGPDCIALILKIFASEKNIGFFYIYELLGNALQISIIPDSDKPSSLGSVLFHILPDSYISGVQRVILQIMESHKELAAKMPVFEDNRRFKIPTLAGLDVFQSHVKNVSSFLKSNRSDIDVAKLRLVMPPVVKPPVIITASADIVNCDKYGEGRNWASPRVMDYSCESRVVAVKLIPDILHQYTGYFSDQIVSDLMSAPLNTSVLAGFLAVAPSLDDTRIDRRGSGITVMNHPSSRSHIARTSVARLENDYNDFLVDSKATSIPYLAALPLDIGSLSNINLSNTLGQMKELRRLLTELKVNDFAFALKGISDLEEFVNGWHPYFSSSPKAVGHCLMQIAKMETPLV
jgi:hypothetical protein